MKKKSSEGTQENCSGSDPVVNGEDHVDRAGIAPLAAGAGRGESRAGWRIAMNRKIVFASLVLLAFGSSFVVVSALADGRPLKHVIVSDAPGRFSGWPANNGVWIYGNEIVVGFNYGW